MAEKGFHDGRGERHRQLLNRKLRAAFIEGAGDDSRRHLGRGLTEEQLRGVLRQHPADVGESPRND